MESFTVGERVRITVGPFAGFLGKVTAIDRNKAQLKIVVEVFGRATPVTLNFSDVEKVSAP